jgi:ParB family chromosome partitioning protein
MTKPTYTKGSLYQIPCIDLQTDPNQPRKYFDPEAQQDLVNSFQKQGVLQPVLFREDSDSNLFIVAGERRLQAAKEAGLETIPAILVEGNYSEIALIENLLREDLTAIELAEALDRIQIEYKYTQDQLTGIIGKAKSTVSDILTLTKLPKEIRDECRNDPKISRQLLINIARKKREKGMVTAYKKYKAIEAKKQIKKTSPKKTKVKRTFQMRLASKFDKMQDFIMKIDLVSIDPTVRKDLTALIQKLKKTADGLLKKIQKVPYIPVQPKNKTKTKKDTPKNKTVKTISKSKAKNIITS